MTPTQTLLPQENKPQQFCFGRLFEGEWLRIQENDAQLNLDLPVRWLEHMKKIPHCDLMI